MASQTASQLLAQFPNPPSSHPQTINFYSIPTSLILPRGVLPAAPLKMLALPEANTGIGINKTPAVRAKAPMLPMPGAGPPLNTQASSGWTQNQSPASANMSNDIQGLFKRALEGPIPNNDKLSLYRGLADMTTSDLKNLHSLCHQQVVQSMSPGSQVNQVEIDNHVMDFRAALPIALNTVVTDTFRINPKGSQTQFRVVSEPSDDSFAIEFVPNGGTLTGAQSVQVKLTIKKPVPVKIVVSVEVARGLRHFIVVRPLSSRDVTNQAQATPNPALGRLRQPSQGSVSQNQHLASPQGLEVGPQRGNGGNVPVPIHQKLPPQAGAAPQPPVRQPRQAQSQPILQQQRQNSNPGNIPQGGVGSQIRQPGVGGGAGSGLNPLQRIFTETQPDAIFPHIPPHPHTPKTLALLRALVMSTREGLACPDIFRDRGNEAEIKGIREKLAKPGVAGSIRTRDALAIGTCIKMYLRDLPVLLCSEIPVQAVMEAKSPAIAYAAVMHMHPQNRDLLEWVLDLIVATCKLEAANGMGLRALCTVFAPNLYGPPTPAPGAEPNQQEMVKFMSASIQMVTFLGLLAAKRMSDLGV